MYSIKGNLLLIRKLSSPFPPPSYLDVCRILLPLKLSHASITLLLCFTNEVIKVILCHFMHKMPCVFCLFFGRRKRRSGGGGGGRNKRTSAHTVVHNLTLPIYFNFFPAFVLYLSINTELSIKKKTEIKKGCK